MQGVFTTIAVVEKAAPDTYHADTNTSVASGFHVRLTIRKVRVSRLCRTALTIGTSGLLDTYLLIAGIKRTFTTYPKRESSDSPITAHCSTSPNGTITLFHCNNIMLGLLALTGSQVPANSF